MSFLQRLKGALKPGGTRVAISVDQVRDAIKAEGDDPTALAQLLEGGTCKLDSGGEGVFPVMSMNRMIATDLNTFPTILAAMQGKPRRLAVLLDHGAGLDVRCGFSRTSLHWAVTGEEDGKTIGFGYTQGLSADRQAASLACTRLLVERGADVDAIDSLKFSPLHRACMVGGKVAHIRLLLEKGARVDAACNPDGETPLLLAIRLGLIDAAMALLDGGAKANHADRRARGPLHWACGLGHVDLVDALLQRGADPQLPDAEGHTPTGLAVKAGSLKALRLVQDAVQRAGGSAALPELWQAHLLLGALRRKDEASLQALLKALDINARDDKGIVWWHYVVSNDNAPESTTYLLDHGANLEVESASGDRALHAAAQSGKTDTVKLLLARGALADIGNWRPLHHAAHHGHLGAVELLLGAGADPCAVADRWKSPLWLAVTGKHTAVAECLIQALQRHGGLKQLPGLSPLNVACEMNEPRLVELLLSQAPDVDAPTQDGWTPLLAAVGHAGDDIVRLLLRAGANPNAPSEAGYTALHRAAAKGRVDLMRLLIQHGADPTQRDNSGTGLAEFAKSSSHPAVAAAVAEWLPAQPTLTDEDYRRQIRSIHAYHLARAPARLAMLERQGVELIVAGKAQNDAENPFVVQWPGLTTAVAAIYRHLDRLFGPQIRQPAAAPNPPTGGWILERVSLEKHPKLHLHKLEILIPGRGGASVFYDITAAASTQFALAALLAHAARQTPP